MLTLREWVGVSFRRNGIRTQIPAETLDLFPEELTKYFPHNNYNCFETYEHDMERVSHVPCIWVRTRSGYEDYMYYRLIDLTRDCCSIGHLPLLQYVNENTGDYWEERTPAFAARFNHVECLRYVHENGCPWNSLTVNMAIASKSIECLRYALENKCPWDDETLNDAAGAGFLEGIKCLKSHGIRIEGMVPLFRATLSGFIECVVYLHENGCTWHECISEYAAKMGHLECLKYAIQNGCPYNIKTLYECSKTNRCLIYVIYGLFLGTM